MFDKHLNKMIEFLKQDAKYKNYTYAWFESKPGRTEVIYRKVASEKRRISLKAKELLAKTEREKFNDYFNPKFFEAYGYYPDFSKYEDRLKSKKLILNVQSNKIKKGENSND